MSQHSVTVWGKQYDVKVNQLSKTVWRAVGDYEGKRIETKGRTESAALNQWKEAARYRGDL